MNRPFASLRVERRALGSPGATVTRAEAFFIAYISARANQTNGGAATIESALTVARSR
jgi:hypothetical protein